MTNRVYYQKKDGKPVECRDKTQVEEKKETVNDKKVKK